MTQRDRTMKALNIVTKWRTHFAGWQLGTRSDTDPVAAAVRDHREATIVLRVELNALTHVLLSKDIVTESEWLGAIEAAAKQLNNDYAARWPGVTASETGLHYELPQAMESMKGWLP